MFLRSLTLRGFKSFSEKTTLEFEPGITVIVGPNGSGKSNVVDALSWVLGTHSAKSLRGGSMADVIFAGSPNKPALGRAAVEITIDNSAGLLPIEFNEVTVSRAMFASGENEYAINGVACRALDVQELLSDTGLGRENHTIVGQGQLDAVLNAKPEERRAFIEEAAGILKHRRRKERALRKLAQMEGHVERLQDVLRELRRNLRPLERQAEAAAKHAELQHRLSEVRRQRALRELDQLSARWSQETEAVKQAEDQLGVVEAVLREARGTEAELERAVADLAPAAQQAAETHFRLANIVERYRGLGDRIEERRRGLIEAVEEPVAGRDPEQLRRRATEERAALAELEGEIKVARERLEAAERARREAEQARRAHEQAAAADARRRSEARERLLRWEGEVSALRSALAQAASEEGRLASQHAGMSARKAELERNVAEVQAEIQRLDVESDVLAEQLASAEALVARRSEAAETTVKHERELERQRASLEARADALRAASQEAGEGAAALLEAVESGDLDGPVGPLADTVRVAEGMARAVAAALGPLGDALVVRSRDAAVDAVGFITSRRSGRVLLVVSDDALGAPDVPDLEEVGARPVVDALSADAGVLAALRRALAGVYHVEQLETATELAGRYPALTFVTAGGEVAGARGWAAGNPGSTTAVHARAAAEQAEAQLAEVGDELLMAHRQVGDADRDLSAARRELDAATAAMQESDGQLTAAAERLKRLHKELESCEGELANLGRQQDDLAQEIGGLRERLQMLEARGVEPVEPDPEGPDLEAERLDDLLAEAREHEVQARLSLSEVEQRGREADRRVGSFEREADDVERQLAEREQRRQQRLAGIERCGELTEVAAAGLVRSEASLALAVAERDRVEEARAGKQRELGAVRARLRELEAQLTDLRNVRHEEDLRRQQLRHALDAVRTRLAEELDVDPDEALAAARAEGEDVLGGDEERDAELARREEHLLRKVALLGTVNPLAVEEFKALEERHRFLTEQLEDLQRSRKDLQQVVEAVDVRIREVFAAAFADVAAQFERVFPRLFEGGEGRLTLTNADDMLTTGVDVEARPPGKRVKRLSLLSGGERSLTALAVLFAIFAARPSPFYVLDEVEAALDDVNLQRFLSVVADFRSSSQLIVVTHQKRTMEVADTLYGVSMQGNGVSKVISQRMTEEAAASA